METRKMTKSYQRTSVKTLFDHIVESSSEMDLGRSKRLARLLHDYTKVAILNNVELSLTFICIIYGAIIMAQ